MSDGKPAIRRNFRRTGTARLRRIFGDRTQSFRLIVYLSIFVFVLLYVFSVRGVESALDTHFQKVVRQAVEVSLLHRPVALQIQDQIERRIQESAWVRIGGVRVTVIVLGHDGTYLYVGGRALLPPPSVDPGDWLRDAQRLLPASAEVIVSVPHNALLSNGILLVYAALLLQGLFVYHRISTRREERSLEFARSARDAAFERSRGIENELAEVKDRLLQVEPAEREHGLEIRELRRERETLRRNLGKLATREEELMGRAARATDLDQERSALEDLLDEATGELSARDDEISRLQSSLQKAAHSEKRSTSARGRETDHLGRRLRTLYPNVEFDDHALEDLVALRDESMKLKAEAAVKKLCDEAENVGVRRKVGGLPAHLTIFELGFAGKGRIYYCRGRAQRFRILAVGAKNSQKSDLDYLARLPKV